MRGQLIILLPVTGATFYCHILPHLMTLGFQILRERYRKEIMRARNAHVKFVEKLGRNSFFALIDERKLMRFVK